MKPYVVLCDSKLRGHGSRSFPSPCKGSQCLSPPSNLSVNHNIKKENKESATEKITPDDLLRLDECKARKTLPTLDDSRNPQKLLSILDSLRWGPMHCLIVAEIISSKCGSPQDWLIGDIQPRKERLNPDYEPTASGARSIRSHAHRHLLRKDAVVNQDTWAISKWIPMDYETQIVLLPCTLNRLIKGLKWSRIN